MEYLEHIAAESLRFAAAIRGLTGDARVPTCPDWDAEDLLWHLAEVQWFWGEIVRTHATGPGPAEEAKPPRPGDRASLDAFFAQASADLVDVLTVAPETSVWTWADDHTVAFVRRRQAHEALIHRVDAELTAGTRTPIDPALAADGVDEALRIMHGGLPVWGTFTPAPAGASAGWVQVQVTDGMTGGANGGSTSWLTLPGTFTGTSPDGDWSGTDEPVLKIGDSHSDEAPVGAVISGTAADLDCWLWNRPTQGPLERSGDETLLAAFDAVLAGGIQ